MSRLDILFRFVSPKRLQSHCDSALLLHKNGSGPRAAVSDSTPRIAWSSRYPVFVESHHALGHYAFD